MPSQACLQRSARAHVRTGPAPPRQPDSNLVVDAALAGRVEEAHEYLKISDRGTERVYGIFTTWLASCAATQRRPG